MGTEVIPIGTLGAEIKARVEAGDKALDRAEQHYIAAGIQLAEAKKRVAATPGLTWPAFLITHCGIRRRRADDLIAIGNGTTTLAEIRQKNRERVADHRKKKTESALRNADSDPPDRNGNTESTAAQSEAPLDSSSETSFLRSDQERLAERAALLEDELARAKAEIARLMADIDALTKPQGTDTPVTFNDFQRLWNRMERVDQLAAIEWMELNLKPAPEDDFDPSKLTFLTRKAA